jgi:hypothetical protein
MSLPNDDDEDQWGQPPPFGNNNNNHNKDDPYSNDYCNNGSKDSKYRILASPSSEDGATAAETSVGSNSVISGFTADTGVLHATPATATSHQQPNYNTNQNAHEDQRQVLRSSNHHHQQQQQQDQEQLVTTERTRSIRHLRALGVASSATFALSVFISIPTPVLLSMMLFLVVFAGFVRTLYQVLVAEWQRIVEGRGVGDYLPAGIYEQLTRTSVHEFMSDTRNSYVNENAYIMLYMIPGLSPEQINEYVGRLSPRHQEVLHRQGLGYVLGTTFMRFVMGDQRLRQLQAPPPQEEDDDDDEDDDTTDASDLMAPSPSGSLIVPRRLELPPTIPEGATEDDESATSELGHEDDPATQFLRHWGVEPESSAVTSVITTVSRRMSQQQTPPPSHVNGRSGNRGSAPAVDPVTPLTAASLTDDAPTASRRPRSSSQQHQQQQQQQQRGGSASPSEATRQAEAEAEEQVIYDAIGSAVATYIGVAAGMVQNSARQSATMFSGTIFRASMSITLLGVGVGIYGFWTGAYNPQTFFQPAWQLVQGQVGALLRPPRRLELPQSEVLIGTTMASGATAGIMLLFQLASAREDEKERQRKKSCTDSSTKDKN